MLERCLHSWMRILPERLESLIVDIDNVGQIVRLKIAYRTLECFLGRQSSNPPLEKDDRIRLAEAAAHEECHQPTTHEQNGCGGGACASCRTLSRWPEHVPHVMRIEMLRDQEQTQPGDSRWIRRTCKTTDRFIILQGKQEGLLVDHVERVYPVYVLVLPTRA